MFVDDADAVMLCCLSFACARLRLGRELLRVGAGLHHDDDVDDDR